MNQLSVEIRFERAGDEAAIGDVIRQAFESCELGYNGEAELADRIRTEEAASISLVAESESQVVGHILFSPATIEWDGQTAAGLGLAPVSVLPDFQRQGIGAQLINEAMALVAEASHEFVIVLGHPEYYPKFGFAPAARSNIACEFEGVPEEAFLIRWFSEPPIQAGRGIAKYHSAFSNLD